MKIKIKTRFLGILLAAVILTSLSVLPAANAAEQEDMEFVTESLSNYLFGYMSWGVKKMGLDALQEKLEKSSKTLPEVRVAVIDSGLNTSNKYLKNRYTNDGYSFLDNTANINDDQYHGTMVSGIIADGTSSNVKILPIKVNDKSGTGKLSNVSKGIYYAIEHGADVINLSISAEDPRHTATILDDAIQAAVDAGVVVVTAAGNQGGDTADRYPARLDNVLTITSVDKNNQIAENANTGDAVDFALPGVSVRAPYYSLSFIDSGTSLAAPHAAAAAALLKTWDKSLNQYQVTEILKQYAVDLGAKGFDSTYGWGMIDLSEFDLNTVKPTEETTETPTETPTEITTDAPTAAPTEITTDAPTAAPTEITTDAPTAAPTEITTDAPTAAPTEKPILIGDADGDGEITIFDATAIQRYLAGILSDSFNEKAADTDGDGNISIFDATYIQRKLAGLL